MYDAIDEGSTRPKKQYAVLIKEGPCAGCYGPFSDAYKAAAFIRRRAHDPMGPTAIVWLFESPDVFAEEKGRDH